MRDPIGILVLCTGNSARSVMAEVLLNALGKGRIKAYSAGSQPAGRINPLTLEVLREKGYATDGLRSKSWDEFAGLDAPSMDVVVTVCDNAAGEVCPFWPGRPVKLHMGFPDPAAFDGTPAERLAEFRRVFALIEARLTAMAAELLT